MAINKTTKYITNPNDIPVETSSGKQTLKNSLNHRVIYSDSLVNLQALDTSVVVDGQQAHVQDDGHYYWDATGASWVRQQRQMADGQYLQTVIDDIRAEMDSTTSIYETTLSKTFAVDESYLLPLNAPVNGAALVAWQKEIPSSIKTSNAWELAISNKDYEVEDFAPAASVTPSATTGDITLTLGGTAAFTTADIGRFVSGNGGIALVKDTAGAARVIKDFTDTTAIAAGAWTLTGTYFNAGQVVMGSSTEKYNLAGTVYDSVSFSVGAEAAQPMNMTFSADGTQVYVPDASTDWAFQYSLTTAWDLSTASYSSKSVGLGANTPNARGIIFKPDGLAMYVVENGTDAVHQYSLTTAWDISTASYASKALAVGTEATDARGLAFNDTGTKVYVGSGTKVFQYSLTTAWDVSTGSYDTVSATVGEGDSTVEGLFFHPDGTRLYTTHPVSDNVLQYDLSTAWDLATATYSGVAFNAGTQDATTQRAVFSSDGVKMFILGYNSTTVYQYTTGVNGIASKNRHYPLITKTPVNTEWWDDLNSMTATDTPNGESIKYALSDDGRTSYYVAKSGAGARLIARNNAGVWEVNAEATYGGAPIWQATSTGVPHDLTDASYDSISLPVDTVDTQPGTITFSPDGTRMFYCGRFNRAVFQYTLSTAWDLSTATLGGNLPVDKQELHPYGLRFKPDGTKMFMVGVGSATVYQYTLSTAWDVTTGSLVASNLPLGPLETYPYGVAFNNDGTKMYIAGADNDAILQYTLSTPWDASTGTYDSVKFSTAGETLNPMEVYFSADGSLMYVHSLGNDTVYQYTLSTAWDVSTAVFKASLYFAAQDAGPYASAVSEDGTKLYMLGVNNYSIYQYSLGVGNGMANTETDALREAMKVSTTNQMDGAQISAVGDNDFRALGTQLDLAMIMHTATDTELSTSSVNINYNNSAFWTEGVPGTDYIVEQYDASNVNLTAKTAGNIRVRVV